VTAPGVFFASAVWNWVHRLGGPGLILLGLADNSVVPLPGSVDALTIILSAHRKEMWWYYAVMATIGGVVGGYLTYRLGHKGGEEALEKKIPEKRAKKVYGIFNKYGFWAVAVPALLPPPVPIVPFLLTAGALKYCRRKFLAALTLGRGVRYTLLAFLGRTYGEFILGFFGKYYRPLLIILIGIGGVAGLVALYYYKKKKKEGALDAEPAARRAA
jgi:membrane protein YqaA with SNARE-associated domain